MPRPPGGGEPTICPVGNEWEFGSTDRTVGDPDTNTGPVSAIAGPDPTVRDAQTASAAIAPALARRETNCFNMDRLRSDPPPKPLGILSKPGPRAHSQLQP